jgi:hypothetical protein
MRITILSIVETWRLHAEEDQKQHVLFQPPHAMSQMCKRKISQNYEMGVPTHETETPMACFPHATAGTVIFR